MCRATAISPRSWGIPPWQPAINNKLAPKPTPNPNSTKLLVPKNRKTDHQITNRLHANTILRAMSCGPPGLRYDFFLQVSYTIL